MALSVVDIFNQALTNLGKDPSVTSLTDASTEREALSSVYDTTRDHVLIGSDWAWASRYSAKLAALSDDNPQPHLTYWYKVPSDSLRIRKIEDTVIRPTRPIVFIEFNDEVQGRVFATDMAEPIIRYTWMVQDPSLFDPGFVFSLAFLLASRVALTLTSNPRVQQGMFNAYRLSLADAVANIQVASPEPGDATWISDRE
jgi:hypothetical protein